MVVCCTAFANAFEEPREWQLVLVVFILLAVAVVGTPALQPNRFINEMIDSPHIVAIAAATFVCKCAHIFIIGARIFSTPCRRTRAQRSAGISA